MLKNQDTGVTLRHKQKYCNGVYFVRGITAKRVGIETKYGLTFLLVWRAE
jgi:hypothetical protein